MSIALGAAIVLAFRVSVVLGVVVLLAGIAMGFGGQRIDRRFRQ